ncbi:hypothetical protein BGAL_0476g00030 [Botrytis galanthina]|uniref:Carboxylic ester hydrolase n=1 Tax=Botrytis galanthina TaxID=278940 RepID=A0A4S8QLQ3_9HELO|nr:hypothetical protein BGAL_0476g00030 [Botrytis galanthina]
MSTTISPLIEKMKDISNGSISINYTVTAVYPSYLDFFYGNNPSGEAAGQISLLSTHLLGRAQLSELPMETLAAYLQRALATQSGDGTEMIVGLQGGPGPTRVPENMRGSLNPVWRDTYVHVITLGATVDDTLTPKKSLAQAAEWMQQNKEALWREWAPDMGAYINEGNPYNTEWKHDFFGTSYERLAGIKTKYDPTGSLYILAGATGMRYGFAAVGTDTGHTDSDMSTSWTGNPESITDWAWRANHEMTVIGGRQSLKKMQMFPEDYDGVAAGCPAWWTTQSQLWNLKQTLYQSPANSSHTIPTSMFSVIANNFDLLPIYNRGGILLYYHGLADGTVAPGAIVYFHDHVARTLTPMGIKVDDFYRFFLVPGLEHCTGTPSTMNAPWYFAGPNLAATLSTSAHSTPGYSDPRRDVLLALMTWVENGTAPDNIIATKFNDDLTVAKQRPICAFPNQAKYDGTGNVDVAEMWLVVLTEKEANGTNATNIRSLLHQE